MTSNRIFVLAALGMAVLQTAILGYMVESRASILRSGAEVLLKTAPVDPRDLFRGDYVILSYDISGIPVSLITGNRPLDGQSQRLNVRLTPGADGFWTVAAASFDGLPAEEGTVIIRTLPVDIYAWSWESGGELRVAYGIERFYVPEGEGLVLEEARNEGRLSVAVRVADHGQAQIRTLSLDGEALYEEPLY